MSTVRLRAKAVEEAANAAVDRLVENPADVNKLGVPLQHIFALAIAAQGDHGDGWVHLDADDLLLLAGHFLVAKPQP